MRIIHNYGLVRVVSDGDPYTTTYNIRVEVKEGEEWLMWRGFNSLSDDYAYSNAFEAAGQAIKETAKKVATTLFN